MANDTDRAKSHRTSRLRIGKAAASVAASAAAAIVRPVIGNAAAAPPPITLRSTLELFGTDDYKVGSFVEQRLNDHESTSNRVELVTRKTLLNEALKGFVTDNYRKFIYTSNSIQYMEKDLSRLHNTLSQYKGAVKKLQEMSFDDEMFRGSGADADGGRIEGDTESGTRSEAHQLADIADEIGTLMHERKLDDAVRLIETVYERIDAISVATESLDQITIRIDQRAESLIKMLTEMLQNQGLKTSEKRRLLGYIIRLGHTNRAIELYLELRTSMTAASVCQLNMTNDMTAFITDLSGIVFSSIGLGWSEFKRVFRNASNYSAYFVWAVNELESFGRTFIKQVLHADLSFRVISQCIHLSILACKMLERQGISLSFVLERMFMDPLRNSFQEYSMQIRHGIMTALEIETWRAEEAWVKQSKLSDSSKIFLTSSARAFYDVVHQFVVDMKLVIFNPAIFDPTINNLLQTGLATTRVMFEEYLLKMTKASSSESVTDDQGLSIVVNSYFLAEDLFPRIKSQLESRIDYRRGLSDIQAFHDQLTKFYKAQRDFFCQKRGPLWIRDIVSWHANNASWYAPSVEPVTVPSAGFRAFAKYLDYLHGIVSRCLPSEAKRMQSRAVAEVLSLLRAEEYWSTTPTVFEQRAFHQLLLDMAFMCAIGEGNYQESVTKCCTDIVDQVRKRCSSSFTDTTSSVWVLRLINGNSDVLRLRGKPDTTVVAAASVQQPTVTRIRITNIAEPIQKPVLKNK